MTVAPQPIKPDFTGPWIGNIIPPLLTREFPDWYPMLPQQATQNVVLVIDGFGWELYQQWAQLIELCPTFTGIPATSSCPSTTGAALPSITLGMPPGNHGILGYRIRVNNGVLAVLPWRKTDSTGKELPAPQPAQYQPQPAFMATKTPVIFHRRLANKLFTQAHMQDSPLVTFNKAAQLPQRIANTVEEGHCVVYAYIDSVDKTGHQHGIKAGPMYRTMTALNSLVNDILSKLPSTVVLSITADHGLIDIEGSTLQPVEANPDWVQLMAGESRCKTLWATPGNNTNLLAQMQDLWQEQAWVLSQEQLIDDHWLSPTTPTCPLEYIPDVMLLPFAEMGFSDPLLPMEHKLVSRHGSATSAEMLVPFISSRGTA